MDIRKIKKLIELLEETGWNVKKITHVATTLTESGRLDNKLHIFCYN